MVNDNLIGKKLKELKPGEYFTKKPIEYPGDRQVFIKREFDRSEKNILLSAFQISATIN